MSTKDTNGKPDGNNRSSIPPPDTEYRGEGARAPKPQPERPPKK